MKKMDYMAVAEKVMKQIREGAFLTVKAGKAFNTMTIGWALIGYAWQKPILMVLVRTSRHTYGFIDKAADFTSRCHHEHARGAHVLRHQIRQERGQVQGVQPRA